MKTCLIILFTFFLLNVQSCRQAGDINWKETTLQLLDGKTKIKAEDLVGKKTPFIIFYFNPECPFCEVQTNDFLANIKDLKDIKILVMSAATLDDIRKYDQKFNLSRQKNIVIGQDYNYSFLDHFQISTVPFIAIYKDRSHLKRRVNGTLPSQIIADIINN